MTFIYIVITTIVVAMISMVTAMVIAILLHLPLNSNYNNCSPVSYMRKLSTRLLKDGRYPKGNYIMNLIYTALISASMPIATTIVKIYNNYRSSTSTDEFRKLKEMVDKLSTTLLEDCGTFKIYNLISYRRTTGLLRNLVLLTKSKLLIQEPITSPYITAVICPSINDNNFYPNMLKHLKTLDNNQATVSTEYVNLAKKSLNTKTYYIHKVIHICKLTEYGFLETLEIDCEYKQNLTILTVQLPVYSPDRIDNLHGSKSLLTHITSYLTTAGHSETNCI